MDLLDSLLQVCLLLRSCLAIYLCNSSSSVLAKICWRYRVHRPVYYHLMSWKSACLVFTSVRVLVGTASAFTQSNSLLLLKESSYARSWKRGWFSWVILQKIPRFSILFLWQVGFPSADLTLLAGCQSLAPIQKRQWRTGVRESRTVLQQQPAIKLN